MGAGRLTNDEGEAPFWRRRDWRRSAGRTSAALWISAALTLLGTVLAARALGPLEYGEVVIALGVTGLVATLLDITLEEGVVHHGFRVLREGDPGALRSLLRAALVVDVGVGVVVAAVLVGAAGPLADIASAGDPLDPRLIMLAAVVPFGMTIDGTTGAVLLLAGRAELRGWCMAAGNVVRVVAMIVAILAGGGPFAVVGAYAVAAVAQTVVQAALAWRLAWREWDRTESTVAIRTWFRRLTAFGVHTSVTTAVQVGERSVIPVVIGALAGPVAAGYYAVALLPLTAVSILSAPIRLLVFPQQARLAAEGAVDQLRAIVRGWVRIALALAVPSAVAGWFAMPWLVNTLFGADFDPAVGAARVMLIAAVLHLAAGWSKTLPAAVGRPQLRSAVAGIFLVVSVGVTAALAAEEGAMAGALGNLAAISVVSVCWFLIVDRVLTGAARRPPVEPAPTV